MNVLINGFNARTGGGRTILDNFLIAAREDRSAGCCYYVKVPPGSDYGWAEGNNVVILRSGGKWWQRVRYLREVANLVSIAALCRRGRIDVILNLADIVLPLRTPQIYFFDWSYLLYPRSVVWQRMPLKEYWYRKIKARIIELSIRFAKQVVVQTNTMREGVATRFGQEVTVLPTPVSVDYPSLRLDKARPVLQPGVRNLLFLATYAAHKNHELVLPLARLIRQNGGKYCIHLTVDAKSSRRAGNLLADIEKEGLAGYVKNLGPLDRAEVRHYLESCDALFLPTLLESYGIPLVEAMSLGTTVIASDYPFIRDVCRDVACYIDPLDASATYAAICAAFSDDGLRRQRIAEGRRIAQTLPTWPQFYARFGDILRAAGTGERATRGGATGEIAPQQPSRR